VKTGKMGGTKRVRKNGKVSEGERGIGRESEQGEERVGVRGGAEGENGWVGPGG